MPSVGWKTLAISALAVLAAAGARAATVYSWTDEHGTLHFGDTPPPRADKVKTQTLPDAPPPAAPAPAADAKSEVPKPGDAKALQGPARVVLTERKAEGVGPSVQAFRGKVKNEGGEEARDVSIEIVVKDPQQGEECVHDRVDVDPSTLAPGAEGTFDAEFDNPCFRGPTEVALHTAWR